MSLIRWEPLRDFETLFDRYIKALSMPFNREHELMSSGDWLPRVDISEDASELNIKAEIPDVQKEDVKVNVENGVITIHGERHQSNEERQKKYHRLECCYGKFTRSFTLPSNIDENNIHASFSNGVLNLHIPKIGEEKPKAIEVSIE